MFAKLLERLFRTKAKAIDAGDQARALEDAFQLILRGEKHAAINALRVYLETDPYNVAALNDLGACLSEIGDEAGARREFELAYSLDDSYLPAIVNHAKMLMDQRRGAEALTFLAQAKLLDPAAPGADVVYANLCQNWGKLSEALHFQMRAWLGNFDNLRFANGHLFNGAYADVDEIRTAAEHRFWAATAKPFAASARDVAANKSDDTAGGGRAPAKIRIGYLSPDFRSHSVRYFFRPLLENHDLSRFEISLYYDFPSRDWQTDLITAKCENFHDVYQLTDVELHELITSHHLDVLVELAGHSSQNRIRVLQKRFAKVQISALGYPPTTGLETVDAKVIDRYISTPDDAHHYTERPLVLPTSFWCFDPLEHVPLADAPPFTRNGYITFACVGNVSKINERILRCWRSILDEVPTSRLLIRAINFEDPAAEPVLLARLDAAHIDLSRVDLRKPEGGANFFASYNEIDIILDTYPFNGGTTTCFATYMGVPVVSWAGNSLISRMGLSILSNLGVPEWVADTEHGYIERAVGLARNAARIKDFKASSRDRFKSNSLGNGKLFALEFERGCEDLLNQVVGTDVKYLHKVPALPADELIRRAYAVLQRDQTEPALRILNHCLENYPNNGSAHLLVAQLMSNEQRFKEASEYLLSRVNHFDSSEKVAVFVSLVRYSLLMDREDVAIEALRTLDDIEVTDSIDRLQVSLYRACMSNAGSVKTMASGPKRRIQVLIPCDDLDRFVGMKAQISACCTSPIDWTVNYVRCDEAQRVSAYTAALQRRDIDMLVIAQKNMTIYNAQFFVELNAALSECDVVGFAGAKEWRRLDWNSEEFNLKAAGYFIKSAEKEGHLEIQCFGEETGVVVHHLCVLDGSLLALTPGAWNGLEFDEELLGAEFLMEEYWTHQAHALGLRLAAHRNLGVLVDEDITWNLKQRAVGRLHLAERLNFNPFSLAKDDRMVLSAPVATAPRAVSVLNTFFASPPVRPSIGPRDHHMESP